MAYIGNYAKRDVELGRLWSVPQSKNPRILIRILDPDMEESSVIGDYQAIHVFKFLDVNEAHEYGAPTVQDAQAILAILQEALATETDVIVHCTAGICRSGAVTEIGTVLGFEPMHNTRIPNVLLKNMMMRLLWGQG